MLNACQRQFTFCELASFSSLDAARDHIIEKEIESILRSSHSDQFDWMENRFGIPLRKDLSIWPRFVELTERRNLFVHCDGIVSSQYLSICGKHGAMPSEDINLGDVLDVDAKYFIEAFHCLFELGVKLGHVLWRKLCPEELESADSHLNNICFTLLTEEKYRLAKIMLHFSTTTLKKHHSEIDRRVFIINYAIALKHLKDNSYKELLKKEDWSVCRQDFQLAIAVLHDKYEEAATLMKAIGRAGRPAEHEYKTWPLFKEFRRTEEFRKAYRQIFKKKYMVEETAQSPKKRKVQLESVEIEKH